MLEQRPDLLNRLPHFRVRLAALVTLQKRALIYQFSHDKTPSQFAAFRHILVRSILRHAHDGILGEWRLGPAFELSIAP